MPEDVKPLRRPVVVIDDDPEELMLLRRALAKTGVADTILTFEEPTEAVKYLDAVARAREQDSPCRIVVFCDLKMPGLDGFAVLQRIRGREFSDQVCVIMVSGCALESDVDRARALGADGYLEKMPSSEVLASCMESPSFAATGSRPHLFELWEASRAKAAARC